MHMVMITMITVNTLPPSGTRPSLNTSIKERNTEFSPAKKLAKFSQNFQEMPPSPARIFRSVTPKGMPTMVAATIPMIMEPFTFSLSRTAIRNKPIKATIAVFAAKEAGLPSFTICSPQLVKSTKPTWV